MNNSQKSVSLVLANIGIGGTEKRIANLFSYYIASSDNHYSLIVPRVLLRKLQEQGVLSYSDRNIVTLFSRFPSSIYNRLSTTNTIKRGLLRFLSPLWNYGFAEPAIRANIRKSDVVHWASTGASYLAYSLPIDKPLVLEVQDATLKSLNQSIIQRSLAYPHPVYNCASTRIQEALMRLAPNSDSNRFVVSPGSFIDYSRTYVGKKGNTVCFLGRLEAIKNPMLLLDAVDLVAKQRSDFRVYLLGDGSLAREVDKRVSCDPLLSKIIERRFVDRPETVLAESLIFVSLQTSDNFHSQALMEGMACGCAVIASDVGETWRLVSPDVGFRIPLNAEILSEKILYLLENYESACKMGERARQKVMIEQNIAVYGKYMDTLYEQAYERFHSCR